MATPAKDTPARVVASEPLKGEDLATALDMVEDAGRRRNGIKPADVPYILLPYQQRWHADPAAIRLCRKGRRIGFSWGALSAEAVLEAAVQSGMDQFYMGYNQLMAAEFISDCAFFARAYEAGISSLDVWKDTVLIGDERKDIVTYKIKLQSGFKIEALSSNPHNWRARQGHARIDEAAFHDNLAEVVKGALAFKMWGGRIDIVSTPNGEENQFNVYIKEILAGKLPWSLHTVGFMDAIAEGFYDRVKLTKNITLTQAEYVKSVYDDYPSVEDAQEELDCIPKRGSGAFFSRMLIEFCAEEDIPVMRYKVEADFVLDPERLEKARAWFDEFVAPIIATLDPTKETVFGQDFGRNGDLSVIWPLQKVSTLRWRSAFVLELRQVPFDVQKLFAQLICEMLPRFRRAILDARGNGQSHAEHLLQLYGPGRIECLMLTTQWYAKYMPKYRQAYEDRNIVVPKDEDIISDHRGVHTVKGIPVVSDAKTKGMDGHPRHSDAAVAGVLAWAAACDDTFEEYDLLTVDRSIEGSKWTHPPTDDKDMPDDWAGWM